MYAPDWSCAFQTSVEWFDHRAEIGWVSWCFMAATGAHDQEPSITADPWKRIVLASATTWNGGSKGPDELGLWPTSSNIAWAADIPNRSKQALDDT